MATDIRQKITDQIIAAIEAGTPPWTREWSSNGQPLHLPLRACGTPYKGINVLALWCSAMQRGYATGQWFTYKQAQGLGAQVRKGERASHVAKYGTFDKELPNGDTETRGYLKGYAVFNAAQIDGLPAELAPDAGIDTGARKIANLEAFFNNVGAQIAPTGGQPCYVPHDDRVQMPHVHQFDTAASYYGTLAHELVHWTGHKSRLDRFPDHTRTQDYAFEELVAELGACFICAQVGGLRDVSRSAAYIESWLRALRNDKTYIFRAAAKAQAAADYIYNAGVRTTRAAA